MISITRAPSAQLLVRRSHPLLFGPTHPIPGRCVCAGLPCARRFAASVVPGAQPCICLLYTSDAADDM
eukprot:7181509-Prymnesium_polylepis.1